MHEAEAIHTVERATDAMELHTGTVPGYRRAHPRGVHFHATFQAAHGLARLSTAEHFSGTPIPAIVRLSNASGNPYAPDRKPNGHGATLGLSIRFEIPSGGYATWAAANLTNFPARTPSEFIRITELSSPTGKPGLKLLGHVATHPHIIPGVKGIANLPQTMSFATTQFNGLHAYFLVSSSGNRRPFRYSWVPDAGVDTLTNQQVKEWPPQYLISEIKHRASASWTLQFTLGESGDPTDDVTAQWPSYRTTMDVGTLRLGALIDDQDAVEGIVFDPTGVVPGIELSDDPILHFRSQVYAESHQRRTAEIRPTIRNE
ncbi:catalase [Curtobacterium flaccumfaciens]|uniref:catalase n=1 Tax=Curtobacterium flaccumfaciens TaxID=2035 RepID=UPI00112B90EB|nr:catalase [Curtobacterium flaccumfaciens]TPG03966.1 catalase [Curtobacterium flaccumfaciens]